MSGARRNKPIRLEGGGYKDSPLYGASSSSGSSSSSFSVFNTAQVELQLTSAVSDDLGPHRSHTPAVHQDGSGTSGVVQGMLWGPSLFISLSLYNTVSHVAISRRRYSWVGTFSLSFTATSCVYWRYSRAWADIKAEHRQTYVVHDHCDLSKVG